jgi:toxin YoeB
MRTITLARQSFDDLKHWSETDVKLLRRILDLMESIVRDPFQGIGKPEALKGNLRGYWSRRINEEHRIVYAVTSETIIVISLRSHYRI